jgi:hypothetical protein
VIAVGRLEQGADGVGDVPDPAESKLGVSPDAGLLPITG